MSSQPYENQVDPIGVQDTGSLFDVLHRQVNPFQYLRELVVNMWEAGATEGRVTLDEEYFKIHGVMKMCFIDNGCGMSDYDLRNNINNLAAGDKDRGFGKNYGIGAKISLAKDNPDGVVYQSWTEGDPDGAEITFAQDPITMSYGLRREESDDNEYVTSWLPGKKHNRMKYMKNDVFGRKGVFDSGTFIRLMGKSADDDTMIAPDGENNGMFWVINYLSQRFFKFPELDGVAFNPEKPNDNRFSLRGVRFITGDRTSRADTIVHGAGWYLDEAAKPSGGDKGVVQVSPGGGIPDANIHWWLLPEGYSKSGGSGNDPRAALTGHFAWLNNDEIYDRNTSLSQMREFGFSSIGNRVVLYIEPERCKSDIGRTYLRADNGTVMNDYLESYQIAFYDDIPQSLKDADKNSSQSKVTQLTSDDIKKYLAKQQNDLPFAPRLSKASSGVLAALSPTSGAGGNTGTAGGGGGGAGGGGGGGAGGGGGGGAGGGAGGGVGTAGGNSGTSTNSPGPQGGNVPKQNRVRVASKNAPQNSSITITMSDETMNPDLKGCSSSFTVHTHSILINQDYYLFKAVYERSKNTRYPDAAIWDEIAKQAGLRLIVSISSVKQLKTSGQWGEHQFKDSITKEALTSAIEASRRDILGDVRKNLGVRFGKSKLKSA